MSEYAILLENLINCITSYNSTAQTQTRIRINYKKLYKYMVCKNAQKGQEVNQMQLKVFIGIINYSIMALIQIEKGIAEEPDINLEESLNLFNTHSEQTKSLMIDKNHDYGEAWRDMRVSSLTDLILQKLLRVKQIEDNKGETLVSEGIDANYQDIVNYAVFALIHLKE